MHSVWVRLLTGGWFVTVVSMSEVLWVLDDGDPGHSNHHSVRPGIQRTGADNSMVHMMKGAGGVFLTAYYCYRS